MKYAIVLQFHKSVTLHVGVIYHRMDDIVQCLFNLHIKLICRVSMAKLGFTVAHVVIHMLANVENQLDARSSGLSIFWWAIFILVDLIC